MKQVLKRNVIIFVILIVVIVGIFLISKNNYKDNKNNTLYCANAICSECDSKTKKCSCQYIDENGINININCPVK